VRLRAVHIIQVPIMPKVKLRAKPKVKLRAHIIQVPTMPKVKLRAKLRAKPKVKLRAVKSTLNSLFQFDAA